MKVALYIFLGSLVCLDVTFFIVWISNIKGHKVSNRLLILGFFFAVVMAISFVVTIVMLIPVIKAAFLSIGWNFREGGTR